MSLSFKLQCHFILIFLVALRGESRYLEVSNPGTDPITPPDVCPVLGGAQTVWAITFVGVSSFFPFFCAGLSLAPPPHPPRLVFLPASSSFPLVPGVTLV